MSLRSIDGREEFPSDDEADALGGYPDGEVECKHCGQGPFTWMHTGVRWRLVGDRGKLHACTGKPASADDFADLV